MIAEEKFVTILIQDSIIHHAKIYGVEGLEQKIKEVYSCMPILKERFLFELKEMINNE